MNLAQNKNYFLTFSVVLALLLILSFRVAAHAQMQQSQSSQEVTFEGVLNIEVSDDFEHETSKMSYVLRTNDNRYVLHFSKGEPQIFSGSTVRVHGSRQGSTVNVSSAGGTDFTVLSSATPSAAVVKKVAVILFNFGNNTTQPYSPDTARSVTFTATSSANAYYQETSFGKLGLEGALRPDGDVYGWYTIPQSSTTCDYYAWAAAAEAAAAADGFVASNYDSIVHAYPRVYEVNCGWSGLATIGGKNVWINGNYKMKTVAHELAHNLGLYHASSYQCTDANGNPAMISDTCTTNEYGDSFDIMGLGPAQGHFNNFHKGRLGWFGWFDPLATQTITESGTYSLAPIEQASGGVQALRIPRTRDVNGNIVDYYYLEYRQPFGFDNFGSADPVANGVSIRIAPDYSVLKSPLLVDTTPSTDFFSFSDSALGVGRTFDDVANGISIQTVNTDSAVATVAVTFGPISCVRSTPSVSLTPASQSGIPGQALAYTLTLINNDNAPCDSSAFSVTPTLPSGWTQTPASLDPILAPGQSMSTGISVASASNAAVGTYNFTETAVNQSSSLSRSVSASYAVLPTTTVNITSPANGSTLPAKGSVTVSATASDPSGIKRIEISIDNKIVKTCTGTTSCSYNWGVSKVSSGTHTVKATAYNNAPVTGSAYTTITVTK